MLYFISNQTSIFPQYASCSIEQAIESLSHLEKIGLDIETNGLNPLDNKILLLQLGNRQNQYVFDIKSFGYKIPLLLAKFLSNTKRLFIGHNIKFDLNFLFVQNILILDVFDTFLAETIVTNGRLLGDDGLLYKNLASLSEKYCNITLDKSTRENFSKEIINSATIEYAALDIIPLESIMEAQLKIATEYDLLEAINLDNKFVPVLAYIERCGIKLDAEKWKHKMAKDLENLKLAEGQLAQYLVENGYNNYVGHIDMFTGLPTCSINWDSPKQVIPFFESLGINCEIVEKGELKKSVNAKVLSSQVKKFPILELYLNYQDAGQRVSTFGKSWLDSISPKTGRIHTVFKQIVRTGRMSCGDNKTDWSKNLQNIPSDDETRNSFTVESGNVFIDCDYSSQEQIVMANQSQEPSLLQFYKNGFTDMHSFVAFLMYPEIRPCSQEDITNEHLLFIQTNYPTHRKTAKSCGFAINYGGGASTIARNCQIPLKDAQNCYDSYFEGFSKLKEYFDHMFSETIKNGYITYNSITRRKYFFGSENFYFRHKQDADLDLLMTNPGFRSKFSGAMDQVKRFSQNYPAQGTAADITKLAAIYLFKEILKRDLLNKVLIVNIVHDELCVECPATMQNEIALLVKDCMERAGDIFCKTVPLKATPIIGEYWVH